MLVTEPSTSVRSADIHEDRAESDHSYMCAVALNANRHVSGVLRGFDQFMNIVLDNAVDEKNKTDIGMVVSTSSAHICDGNIGSVQIVDVDYLQA